MGSGIGKRADAKATGALARVEAIEQGLQQIVIGCQQSFSLIEQRMQTLEELVTAISKAVGTEQIRDIVTENRRLQQEAAVETAKAAVSKAVKAGQLLPAVLPTEQEMAAARAEDSLSPASSPDDQPTDEALTSKYLIVGRELDKDGNVIPPGRLQLPFSRLLPEIKVKLAGQGPGITIDTPNDRKFVLDEVYIENPNPVTPENDVEAVIEEGLAANDNGKDGK
jgi:hypothetical protein